MPVDYSKWAGYPKNMYLELMINYVQDALELSDDSDIEGNPNVDKKSFIRAKQSQIHADRARRRHQIETLEYEDIVNQGLLIRIDCLLTALKSHKTESGDLEGIILQSTLESLG